ncbi:MAG TPA: MarC family protein, partial [Methanocorpusculum sp.]|nr:MarC family protein [Methanocorpusculum sp.]
LDPLVSTSIFIELTRGLPKKEIVKQAGIATAVAGIVMVTFLLFNDLIMRITRINLPSFEIAGGIILLILGIQIVLEVDVGRLYNKPNNPRRDHTAIPSKKLMAGVLIGTPIMCGPGTITTVMIYGHDNGILITFISILIALLAIWTVLSLSHKITELVGESIILVLSKICGLLLTSIAINTIWKGIMGILELSM